MAKTVQDDYSGSTKIASATGTEVSGGVLQNKVANNQAVLLFDGVDDYINVADDASLDFTTTMTVCAWMYKKNLTSYGTIIDKFVTTGDQRSWSFRTDNTSGKLVFVTDADGSAGTASKLTSTTNTVFTTLQWTHVAVVKNGTDVTFYVNGVAVADDGTAVDNSMYAGTGVVTIGANNNHTANFFGGLLNNVSVYSGALSGAEIISLMQGLTVPTDYGSAVSWWKLDEDTGTSATDSVGSNTGTISATWTNNSNYFPKGTTVSTANLGKSSIKAANSFKYTNTQKGGGRRNVYQFSDDNTAWKNIAGKSLVNAGAYSFDGVDDTMRKTVATYRSGDSAGSVSMWVKLNKNGVNHTFFSMADDASATRYFVIQALTTGTFQVGQRNNDTADSLTTNDTILADLRWHFITVVSSGVAWTIYCDGKNMASTAAGGGNTGDWFADVGATDNLTIGYLDRHSNGNFTAGLIRDVSVYTDQLTQAQHTSLMLGDTLPTDYNVVSRWILGADANDSVGSDHMTVSGAVSVTDWWRLNYQGDAVEDTNALYFDGAGDYIEVANEGNFDFERTDDFSMQCWVRIATAGVYVIMGKLVNATSIGYQLITSTAGVIQVNIRAQTTPSVLEIKKTCNEILGDGVWHLVTMTYDGSSTAAGLKIYLDAIECTYSATTDTLSGSILNNIAFQISGREGNNYTMLGEMANAAVWNDVRTPAEILTDFQNGYIDVSNANLVSSWAMNEGTGTAITDSEGANAGTINGNPQWIKDEYRPIPAAPTQQTIDISTIGAAWNNFYYREFRETQSGLYSAKTTEATLEYKGKSGGLLLQGVGQ